MLPPLVLTEKWLQKKYLLIWPEVEVQLPIHHKVDDLDLAATTGPDREMVAKEVSEIWPKVGNTVAKYLPPQHKVNDLNLASTTGPGRGNGRKRWIWKFDQRW